MGFFTNAFMEAERVAVLGKIAKMQYEYDGTWSDATITSKEVVNNSVVVRASVAPTAEVGVITGVRFLNSSNVVIGSQEVEMPTSMTRPKLIVLNCPIQEV